MKSKNFDKFPNNRITFFDDFAVGQKVWYFYQFENNPTRISEGIIEGEIITFIGFALDIAIVRVCIEKETFISYKVNVDCLNRIEEKFNEEKWS